MAIIYSYPRRIPLASDIMLAAEISAPGEDPPVVKSFTVGQLIELIEGGGGIYAPLDSPQFTGTPYLPIGTTGVTGAISSNSTSLATTAFVQNVIAAIVPEQQTLQQVTTKGNVTTTSIEANLFKKTGGTGTNILLDDGNIVALSSIVGNTNLSTSQTAANFTINSDTGNDAVVPLGNGIDAGATLNNYTTAEQTKLAGIAPGAQVNVNADWNATGGDAQILNKPTIPSITNLVPYTGATANVDLGLNNITANSFVKSVNLPNQILASDGSVITAGTNITITGGTISSVGGTGGGGSSVNYYLNGGTNQGTFGGSTYYEFSKTAVIGTGADFSRSTNGYIASFITDVADPSLLLIPAGSWNLEFFFSSSSAGGSPEFYVELYKYDGTTFTSIASNSTTAEGITNGTSIDAYFTPLAVPETILTVNDRLAIRVFVNASSKTITLHTQNGHLCEVITTFTSGVTGTGTTNYISKFAGTTVIGNSQIFDDGTNIGIGTTLPTAKLEVLSTNFPVAKITRSTALTSALRSTFAAKHLTSGDMLDGFGPDVSFIIQDNSNVENEIANFGAVRDGLDNSGALIFSTRQSGVRYDRMKLFSDGRLALATDFAGVISSPQYKLYVNGSQYLQNINQQLFLDDFNRTSVSPGGNPTIAYTLGTTGGSTATISSTQLRIPNNATTSLGYTYVTGSIPLSYNGDVVYNTILEKNIGLLTWSFNFRTGRSIALEGFAPGQFGLSTILCTNSTDPQAVGAKGYAVYYINNQVFLVYFADGLVAYSTVTAVSPLGLTQDYYSARVTYDCGTAKWNLEVRNDGASAFSNPNSGIYTLQSGFVTFPTLLTPISMPYFGWLWNFNTTTTVQSAFFDNFGFNILTGGSLLVDGNIGIGTTLPSLSAKLDITSTTQGFLPPRMTTTQINAISSPAFGLGVYNTTLNVLCYRDDVGWKKVTSTVM